MIPEQELFATLQEEEFWFENLISNLIDNSHKKELSVFFQQESRSSSELSNWLLRTGISPHSYLVQSHIGLYTDFT